MPAPLLLASVALVLIAVIVGPIRIVILWRRGEFDNPTYESLVRLVKSELLGPIGVLFALAALLLLAMIVSVLF